MSHVWIFIGRWQRGRRFSQAFSRLTVKLCAAIYLCCMTVVSAMAAFIQLVSFSRQSLDGARRRLGPTFHSPGVASSVPQSRRQYGGGHFAVVQVRDRYKWWKSSNFMITQLRDLPERKLLSWWRGVDVGLLDAMNNIIMNVSGDFILRQSSRPIDTTLVRSRGATLTL